MRTPEEYSSVLGQHFITQQRLPVLTLGKQKYDKFQLAELGIPQITAARLLDRTMQRLSIKGPADLRKRLPELATVKGIGTTTFYVAVALASEDGGIEFLRSYETAATPKHPNGKTVVTFSTMRERERHRVKAERRKRNPKPITEPDNE